MNTNAKTMNNNTNLNNKGENTMKTKKKSTFMTNLKNRETEGFTSAYAMFDGYTIAEKYMMPKKINFKNVNDKMKFFSQGYAIAGATGVVTEGVYRVLNAANIDQLSKTIKNFGKEGTKARTGQTYTAFPQLIKSTQVIPRLGGGSMRVRVCSRFEVKEFFDRITKLDTNALTMDDLNAIKDDMNVIGRVMQEIAIDIAKNKDLDAGVDLMDVFAYIPVLSRLVRKADDGVVDNTKSIKSMVRDAIAKNPVINNETVIDSIPDYKIDFKEFEQEYIKDWASDLQVKLARSTEDFFNDEDGMMSLVKTAGVTREDLEIEQLVINNGDCVDEMKKIIDLYDMYVRSLSSSNEEDGEMASRIKAAKVAADKEVKSAFRDNLYAIGRSYGFEDSVTRKLVYGATMKNKHGFGVQNANISKAMAVLGEDDILLMWSNEEGITREAAEVELVEVYTELFTDEEISELKVSFTNDIGYNEEGEIVAYGCNFDQINGTGTIVEDGYKFMFIPDKDVNLAPIGNKRVAFMNRYLNAEGFMNKFMENKEVVISDAERTLLEQSLTCSGDLFFIPVTKIGDENAIGIVRNGQPVILGTSIKVGNSYHNDMFMATKVVGGVTVPANNKKHSVDKCIACDYGMLLTLNC